MNGTYGIGVDLGATHIRVALADEEGKFLAKLKQRTTVKSPGAIIEQIARMIHRVCKGSGVREGEIEGVGIASIGPLRLRDGTIAGTPNLPFKQVPLVQPLREKMGTDVYLLNDCTASVLAEHEYGAGKDVDDLVYITISTGIGCGALVDGHLLLGKDGNAHEIGHTPIDPSGRLVCGCGGRGHWEAYCSGKNIPNFLRLRLGEMGKEDVAKSYLYRLARGKLSDLTAEMFFAAARARDGISLGILEEIAKMNAMGFANAINAYDPSLITVGGSVVLKNEDLVLKPIGKYLKDYAINRLPDIKVTPLGEDVGLHGAVALAFKGGTLLKGMRT